MTRAIEEPADNAVVWTGVQIELGRYAACVVADKVLTTTAADAAEAAYLAFPILAGCISGKNNGQQRLEPALPQLLDSRLPLRKASRTALRCWLVLR